MARRLSTKHRKSRRDAATEYKTNGKRRHKVAAERSVKALYKKSNPA